MWPFRAVALAVGHCDADRQIALVHVSQVGIEPRRIIGPFVLIDPMGRLQETIERIAGEIALRASRLLTNQPHRFQLVQQVRTRVRESNHAVDRVAARLTVGSHDRRELLAERIVVGESDRIHARTEQFVVSNRLDVPAPDVDVRLERPQRLPILR